MCSHCWPYDLRCPNDSKLWGQWKHTKKFMECLDSHQKVAICYIFIQVRLRPAQCIYRLHLYTPNFKKPFQCLQHSSILYLLIFMMCRMTIPPFFHESIRRGQKKFENVGLNQHLRVNIATGFYPKLSKHLWITAKCFLEFVCKHNKTPNCMYADISWCVLGPKW